MHVDEQVWSSGALKPQHDTSADVELQQSNWLRGDKLKAILLNADGEVSNLACYTSHLETLISHLLFAS